METTSTERDNLPLSAHTKKQIRFAEILAKGIYSIAEAARLAGYKQSVADGRAYAWIGKTRDDSEYPVLYDYYEKLRRENLRELDITADTIARELALIAFSDVTRFIDLPRKEYERKALRAHAVERAVYAVESYPERLEAYSAAVARQAKEDQSGKKKPGRKAEAPREPKPPTMEERILYDEFLQLNSDQRAELMVWKNYRAGSIRLKNAEEIPASLLPSIAELSETKDGVKLKLYDKIAALDKLAKWRKMYAADNNDEGDNHIVTEIKLTVNGTRSTLLSEAAKEEDQEEAA